MQLYPLTVMEHVEDGGAHERMGKRVGLRPDEYAGRSESVRRTSGGERIQTGQCHDMAERRVLAENGGGACDVQRGRIRATDPTTHTVAHTRGRGAEGVAIVIHRPQDLCDQKRVATGRIMTTAAGRVVCVWIALTN
jgi:hypothetical protein